jgi:hypothetical protein
LKLVIILLAGAACAAGQGIAPKAVFVPPDGHWWLATSPEARDGFAIGQIDCDAYLLRHPGPAPNDYQFYRAITQYYRAHSKQLALPVTAVISRLNQEWEAAHTYPIVRSSPAKELDDDIWWNASPTKRAGMIRGFLACQVAETGAAVSVGVQEIARRVSRWYGIAPNREGVDNPATARDKLSTVIQRAEAPSAGH